MINDSKKRTTIKHVAKKAGVSVATVSRVFNDQAVVKEEKRQRVLDAIKELNYVPNPAARSLGKDQVYKVAVILPNIINSSLADIVRGVFETCYPMGVDILLFNSNENPEIEKKSFLTLSDKLVEGVIFIAQCGENLDLGKLNERMPIVIVERGEEFAGVDKFILDDYDAMDKIIEHLYKLGHRRIAHLSGLSYSYNSKIRMLAFKKALEKYGLPYLEDYMVHCKFSFTGGKEGFTKLTEGDMDFTAIVCSSDMIGVGAVGAAINKGIKVPEEMSICGYDGYPETECIVPALTSIDYPAYKIGVLAGEAIMNKLSNNANKEGEKIILKAKLIKRDTTGPAPKGKRK